MQEISTPLLGRRRLEDESNPISSHNLTDRRRDSTEEEDEEEEEGIRTDYGSGVYRYPHYLQPGHFTSLEKLQFFISSILFILLCVFVGLYARSSQQDASPVLPLPVPTNPKNHTKKQMACLEPNCIITAAQILQDVDQELDPCDDFYAYTCSKWRQSHVIPDAKSKIDIPSIMTESIRHRLDRILSRDFHRLELSNLPDPNEILDRQLFTKLQYFYQSCMNQDMIEQKSISPLYPLFRSIRAFLPLNANNNNKIKDGINQAIQYLSEKNIWPLFELKVEPDIITNPSKPSLVLYQGQVGLHDSYMYEDPDMMRVYMQVVTSLLDVIFKKDINNEFGWKSWSTIATARRIIEFEKKIVSSFTTMKNEPQLWTLEELQEKLPQIHWTELFTVQPTHVLIPHSAFIDNLNQDILSEMNPRTLQMYFIWRIIWHHLSVLGQEMTTPKRILDAKTSGIEPRSIPERWETCIDLLDKSALGILLGRYYVNDHDIVHAKKVVQDMTQNMVHMLVKRIPDLPWATDRDKQEIIHKLQTMEFGIGYPNSQPNIQSVISLAEYFGDINMNPNDFFGNMMKSNKLQVKHNIWHALEEPTRHVWNPQSTRISYSKELNQVIIPGGLLQSPMMDPKGPTYFYDGTIGWLIGHEITRGFDTLGRQYNTNGLFGSWLNNTTLYNLDSHNHCLVSQYNAFGLNGKETLDNNFADVGGVQLFELLLLNSGTTVVIPGLNDWTKDQLAYIQFARMKCSKSTLEYKKSHRNIAPDSFRVNGPLINSNHFSTTFGCKLGSFMNPDDKKCQVW